MHPAIVEARQPRKVILLDFSRPASVDAPTKNTFTEQTRTSMEEIASEMASQFTGAPRDDPGSADRSALLHQIARSEVGALQNPFTLFALPLRNNLTGSSTARPECASAFYRPELAFGQAAEERRRILFPLVYRAACEVGLPVGLFDAMIMQESRYKPAVTSSKGAFGLAQLMPGTAAQLGIDRYDLLQNLRGGARYLKQHVDRFGRYDLALAAYNAGPGRVERRWRVPEIAETQEYVRSIIANWAGAPRPPASPLARRISNRRAQLVFAPAPPTF